MHNKITTAFSVCNERNCIESIIKSEAHIHDPQTSKCIILEQDASRELSNFRVLNPNGSTIFFLCIDRCIFLPSDAHKKCDFALFDDKFFCFVEIKDTLNPRQKGKAASQLKETIIKFKELIDFNGYIMEAIIGMRYEPPKPAASTSLQFHTLDFEENLGVRLLEGNEKKF